SSLTVPAFLSPPSRSESLHEIATPKTKTRARSEADVFILASLTRDDRFHLSALEQSDHAVAAVPYTIFRSPDLVGFDFSAAGQHYYGLATLTVSDSWSTRRHWIARRACVRSRNLFW